MATEEKNEQIPVAEVEKAENPKPEVVEAEDGIESLKKQLEAERSARRQAEDARQEAERQAFEASRNAYTAKTEVEDTNLRMVENAIETVKGNVGQLKSALTQALKANDAEAVAEIQVMLNDHQIKLRDLEAGRDQMAAQPKAEPPKVQDPVEALAQQLTPRSAAWVRAHPEFAKDKNKFNQMIAAHNLVTARGIAPDTDEYFQSVERTLELTPSRGRVVDDADEGEDSALSAAAAPTARRSSPAAAPVSRASSTGGGQTSGRVRLTEAEVEAAAASGITPEQYYQNKVNLRREGRVH